MSGFLKDQLTVALDDVGRTASKVVTIYDDLSAIASEPAVSQRLSNRGEGHRQALVAFNQARQAAGHTPEVGDPERAHLQSLWLALKAAVAGEHSEERLQASLSALDDELRRAIRAARERDLEPDIRLALDTLTAELERPT